jgi:Tfp pilus assembly PilM family ATPase
LNATWGLDIGESELVAVRVAASETGLELQDFAYAPIPANPAGRGPAETRHALAELARRLHLRRAVVHAATPGAATVLRDERLGPEELEGTPETVRHHLLDLLPGDLSGRDVRYEPRDRDGDVVTYRLLSVPHEEVERAAEILAEADLGRTSLQSGALALTEAAERLLPRGEPVALVDVGIRVTTLSVHRDGRVDRYRVPAGEEDLAAAVSSARGISTAEAYRQLADSPLSPEVSAALKAPLEALGQDLARLLTYDRTRNDAEGPETLHAVGPVAARPGVLTHLASGGQIPVRPLPRPDEDVLRPVGRARREEIETAFPRLLGALGTALLGARTDAQPLALRTLPPAPEPVRIGLHVAASVLLLALVVVSWMLGAREEESFADLVGRQAALDRTLPAGSRSPEEMALEQNRVQRRLDLLRRKTLTSLTLRGVDGLYPKPRVGQAYRLESVRLTGARVEASVLVHPPPDLDAERTAREHAEAATAAIRRQCGCEAEASLEIVPRGYRLRASWTVEAP